ncbi:MAG TPA: rhodanese-like domain-containing protein [Anaerolineae bacterium]|jgi:rhodanese-related sulfurtransferase|nr:rhodanese-like domain-containing protein [Anaerolineae bacterium]
MAHEHKRRKYKRPERGHLIRYEELLFEPERITKEELKKLIDEDKNPLILDVRGAHGYRESDIKIKGSVRIPPAHVHDLVDALPKDRPIIVY